MISAFNRIVLLSVYKMTTMGPQFTHSVGKMESKMAVVRKVKRPHFVGVLESPPRIVLLVFYLHGTLSHEVGVIWLMGAFQVLAVSLIAHSFETILYSKHAQLASVCISRLTKLAMSKILHSVFRITHHGMNKMVSSVQMTYSNTFSWLRFLVYWFKVCWNVSPNIQFIRTSLVMFWRRITHLSWTRAYISAQRGIATQLQNCTVD